MNEDKTRELAKQADLDWHKHWNDDETNKLKVFSELIEQHCTLELIKHQNIDHQSNDQHEININTLIDFYEKRIQHLELMIEKSFETIRILFTKLK